MADSAWTIRFFQGNNYKVDGNIDYVSNFKKGKSRQSDSIVTYSGMYGIDNYLIWNIHKDLPNYDFSTVVLNLNLCLYKNPDIVYFQDFYRVQDIKFNPNKSQYTLFAISETSIKLHAKLTQYNVTSLSYKENRKASDIIKEVIEDNNIFYVLYHKDKEATEDMIEYEYRYFDIDPEWTVLDFIEYICNDNMFEWTLDKQINEDNEPIEILHFGHELEAMSYRNATKDFEIEKDNISHSIYSMKITTDGSSMEPLAHWKEELRCIWSKHAAGKGGAISKGCFIPIGKGHFDKYLYLRTLEGNIEREIGYSMLTKGKKRFPSVSIGNILKDESVETDEFGNTTKMLPYIDIVSVQKNPDSFSIREPHNILIDRGDDIAVQHQLEKITRSTPYLDHEAGLLFPSPKLDSSPPNSLVFNIDGKRESAVVGGYVYGNGRMNKEGGKTLTLPFKEKKGDFRLQFPNGWCLYIDEEGNTQLLARDVDPTTKPNIGGQPSQEAIQIITKKECVPSEIRLFCENNNYIDIIASLNGVNNITNIANTGEVWIKGGIRIKITTGNLLQNYVVIGVSGEDNAGIKILTVGSDPIDIESESGTININTKGTVNVGNDASVIRLGGGGNKISHGDHKHLTGNMGIVIPPHATTDDSDVTEVD